MGALANRKNALKIRFLGIIPQLRGEHGRNISQNILLLQIGFVVVGGVMRGGATCILRHYLELYHALQYHSGNNTFLQLAGVVYCLFTIF